MVRVRLEIPAQFRFSTEVRVRIDDINYGGHLGNDAVLRLAHEARIRFLNKYGFTEADIEGVGLIMTDAVIVYKSEGFHGDVLIIDVAVTDFSRTGCDFIFRLTNKENGKEVARVKTGIVFFDYRTRKVVPVPRKFEDLMSM